MNNKEKAMLKFLLKKEERLKKELDETIEDIIILKNENIKYAIINNKAVKVIYLKTERHYIHHLIVFDTNEHIKHELDLYDSIDDANKRIIESYECRIMFSNEVTLCDLCIKNNFQFFVPDYDLVKGVANIFDIKYEKEEEDDEEWKAYEKKLLKRSILTTLVIIILLTLIGVLQYFLFGEMK